MPSFIDSIRRGRDQAMADRKGRPSPVAPRYPAPREHDYGSPPGEDYRPPYNDPPPTDGTYLQLIAELESALRQRDAQCAELRQLVAELEAAARAAPMLEAALQQQEAECAALRQSVAELQPIVTELAAELEQVRAGHGDAVTASLIAVLSLPGVETWLRKRFHPDMHAGANDEQKVQLDEATKSINAAYSAVRERKSDSRN